MTGDRNEVLTASLLAMTRARPDDLALEPREMLLARLAALVATDAQVSAYRMNISASTDVELTVDDVNSLLLVVVPIVGTGRVAAAAGRLARALDLPLELDEALSDLD